MEKIKIFLASSKELKSDREKFEIFINRKNKSLFDKDYFLELVIWEDFLDAMSQTRLQDEYNKAICESDIFVMLYSKKVGQFTAEEFEIAFGQFKKTNKPLIYTYFKDELIYLSHINQSDILSLFEFQKRLELLGHFQTYYKNIEDLQLQFNGQLELYLNQFLKLNNSAELKLAKELVVFLEDRRVLSNLYANEYPDSVLDSIHSIRNKITEILGKLDRNTPLAMALVKMRKSCKKFLDYVQIIDLEKIEKRSFGGIEFMYNLYAVGFFSALGILREEFGKELFNLTESYNITIGDELSPILPKTETTSVQLTGYLLIFEHGFDPKLNIHEISFTYLLAQRIKSEKFAGGEWVKIWFIEDKDNLIPEIENWRNLHEKEVTVKGQLLDDTERISISSINQVEYGIGKKNDDLPDELKSAVLRFNSLDNLNWY